MKTVDFNIKTSFHVSLDWSFYTGFTSLGETLTSYLSMALLLFYIRIWDGCHPVRPGLTGPDQLGDVDHPHLNDMIQLCLYILYEGRVGKHVHESIAETLKRKELRE